MNEIPTIQELYNAIASDLRNRLNLSDEDLRQVVDAMASVLAAQFKLSYLLIGDIQNNLFPDTADSELSGGQLERIGRIYLNRNPNPATTGDFVLNVTGTANSVLRAGLTFKANDGARNPGELYILENEYILTGSSDTITVTSLNAGLGVLLDVDNTLTITEPVIGVNQEVSVSSVATQPTSAESLDAYRTAILNAIQLEPQGGARTDYRLWAADAAGVRRVYPYVKSGDAGTVQVFVEANAADSTDQNGTPSAALLQDVTDVIEFDPDTTKPIDQRGRRPIQATIETLAVTVVPVSVQITGLNEDTASIRQSISNNLIAFLSEVRPFVSGADLARNKNDILYLARLQSVVTDTLDSSNFFTNIVMTVQGTTQTSFLFDGGNIPYLDDVTYN